MIRLEGVTVRFGGVVALQDVDIDVGERRIVGLIGPNGAGKSTLLSVLTGDVPPSMGRVLFDGQDVSRKPPARRCRDGVCRTHQVPRPLAGMTVYENVLVGKTFGNGKGGGVTRSVDEILELTGLTAEAHLPAEMLGPSNLRRLELARAAATGPRLLLVDEIAAGLPSDRIPAVVEVLKNLAETGTQLVVVEHVMQVVVALVEYLYVLDNGRLLTEGDPREVLEDPLVIDTYFGAGYRADEAVSS